MKNTGDTWNSGYPYEYFMGRWSKLMAPVFLQWLKAAGGLSWLDVGCGTGALSEAIYSHCKPAGLSGIDPSAEFLESARERLPEGGDFVPGNASNIPKPDKTFDMVVSGLALNFFPDLSGAFSEMKRVLKPNGVVAAYVWDYAGRMDFLRLFWDAAGEVDPEASRLDEGIRFPICNIDNLENAFQEAGLADIKTSYLDITTTFRNFEDYWNPFLGGQGPAPGYLAALREDLQEKLKMTIHRKLPLESDGSIKLLARAIAVQGVCK